MFVIQTLRIGASHKVTKVVWRFFRTSFFENIRKWALIRIRMEVHEKKDGDKKKYKKRMKKLYSQIKDQMEFYFSDANISKDRFLGKLVHENSAGYVDLDIFKKFNKLRTLSTDMKVIIKALSFSSMLELNEDKTMVRRKSTVKVLCDVDERTVYIECLPSHVDHDWVKKVFSVCGDVLYVSLPRYKSTGDFKGFGFVEFRTKDQAAEAIKMMNNPPSDAPQHAGKFPKTSKQTIQLEKKQHEIETSKVEILQSRKRTHSLSETDRESTKPQKRRRTVSENNGSNVVVSESKPVKFILGSSDDDDSNSDDSESSETPAKKPKLDPAHDQEAKTDEEKPRKKKNKTRKNKKKNGEKKNKDLPRLRVLTKKSWLSLRNEYLNLQKRSMSELKEAIKEHTNRERQKEEEKQKLMEEEAIASRKKLEFVPGVIIHLKSTEPTNRKLLKEKIPADGIAYIDLKDEAVDGYIRCLNVEGAKAVLDANVAGIELQLLQGEEEKQYWERIEVDRKQKLSSKTKQKKRGSQKVLKKAESIVTDVNKKKHIYFDDN
ncbi:la-related protein 7-like [Tubulanus polymorphus]|uniref:la-related protein 7-like n=1 Tax=Tubulanus polymorphus TaxID=672921 RepID=UPI003DA43237